jgi:hypothetical protein
LTVSTSGGLAHPAEVKRPPVVRIAVLTVCLLLIGLSVAWLFFPMRAVMDVGGYCAEGGPYVIETPCPDGASLFLMLGVPLWFAGVFVGLFAAATISAPQPIFAGWALLFGALGWNFMDYAFTADPNGGIVASWLACGIVFWLMALPGLVIFVGGRFIGGRKITDSPGSGLGWVAIYAVLLVLGWWLGSVSLHAWG